MAFAVIALVQLSHIMTYVQAYDDWLDGDCPWAGDICVGCAEGYDRRGGCACPKDPDYDDLDDMVAAGIIDTYP